VVYVAFCPSQFTFPVNSIYPRYMKCKGFKEHFTHATPLTSSPNCNNVPKVWQTRDNYAILDT